jgi:prevent-host-death family protein
MALKRFTLSHVRNFLADVLSHVVIDGESVILTKHGADLAAIVSIEDHRLIEKRKMAQLSEQPESVTRNEEHGDQIDAAKNLSAEPV